MKHITALLYKLIIITVITAFFTMTLGALDFGQTLTLSIILTALLYPVGDLYVLPMFGNWTAAIVDAVAAAILVWAVSNSSMMPDITFTGALIIGVAIGIAEYFYHQYLQKEVLPGSPMGGPNKDSE